jgi:hypothetical protein
MREDLALDAINGDHKKSGKSGLVVLLFVVAHLVFYFAPSLYLPFDLAELFVFGHLLVIADSGLLVFLGIKLLGQMPSSNTIK